MQSGGAAANGCPEIDIDGVFEIRAGLRPALRLLAPRLIEHPGEDVAKTAPTAARAARSGLLLRSRSSLEVGKVEAFEVEGNFLLRPGTGAGAAIAATRGRLGLRGIDLVGVKAELVVDFALFVVAQDVVSF